MNKKTLGEKYYLHSLIFSIIFSFLYIFGNQNSFFYASILDYKTINSDIFDGTIYPIEFVPNPLELSYEERKQNFEDIDSKYFIETPVYDPDIFGKDLDSLETGTDKYNDAMIQKVVYTVPYMGSYEFDYKEYSGSHPGVDIVAPEGTPVRNIAAGLVIEVDYQSSGFGNYVLIKHSNVLLQSGEYSTIYSLYAHLSETTTKEGEKVEKGEIIGLVGNSGTATTSHLHFQIDDESAPNSPYWPFTSTEAQAAGVGFFDAISMGLGQENAILYTINPLKFVNYNFDYTIYASSTNTDDEILTSEEESIEENTNENNEDEKNINNETIDENKEDSQGNEDKNQENEESENINEENTEIKKENLVVVNKSKTITKENILKNDIEVLVALNTDSFILEDNSDLILMQEQEENFPEIEQEEDEIILDTKDNNSITTKNKELENTNKEEEDSSQENIIDENNDTTEKNIEENLEVIENEEKLFDDIDNNYKYYNEIKYFKDNGIISGFEDNTFRPKNDITRIEALKIIFKVNNIEAVETSESNFLDIESSSWENTYVNAGIENGIISTKNKYFNPSKSISRAEALKIILTLGKVNFETLENNLEFDDVSEDDWFYKYVNYAIKNNLMEINGTSFTPNTSITRKEVVYILYNVLNK